MFSYENTVTGSLDVVKLWELYSDVGLWPNWDMGVQGVRLDGEFAAGAHGNMLIDGMPPLAFTLTEVKPGSLFVVSSTLDDFTVIFGHYIVDAGNGSYTLRHTVTVTGKDDMQVQGVGRGITANIPASMDNLLRLAKAE